MNLDDNVEALIGLGFVGGDWDSDEKNSKILSGNISGQKGSSYKQFAHVYSVKGHSKECKVRPGIDGYTIIKVYPESMLDDIPFESSSLDDAIEAVKRAQGCVPGEIMGIDYDEEFPLEISDEDKEYPLRAEISKPALTLLERRGVDSVKVYEKLIADLARVDPRMLEYAKKLLT